MHTDVENAAVTSYSNPILRHVRDNGDMVLFESIRDIAVVRVPQQVLSSVKVPTNVGDAFYINNAKLKRIKVAFE